MSKKNHKEYYHGKPGAKYGIYNTAAKCFQFGIREDTPMLAEARLFQMIGDDARKRRFEPRRLSADGLRAKITSIDEMHVMRVSPPPASRKAAVFLSYDEEKAAILFGLLYSKMGELMEQSTKDRLCTMHLRRAMQFCAEQLKALAKYAKVGDIEG